MSLLVSPVIRIRIALQRRKVSRNLLPIVLVTIRVGHNMAELISKSQLVALALMPIINTFAGLATIYTESCLLVQSWTMRPNVQLEQLSTWRPACASHNQRKNIPAHFHHPSVSALLTESVADLLMDISTLRKRPAHRVLMTITMPMQK